MGVFLASLLRCDPPPRPTPHPPLPLSACSFFGAGSDEPHFFMDRKEVTERVMHVLHHFDGIDESKLSPTASLEKDLGLCSLDRVEFVFALEQEFNITISDEAAEKLYEGSVADSIDFLGKVAMPQ